MQSVADFRRYLINRYLDAREERAAAQTTAESAEPLEAPQAEPENADDHEAK